MNARSFIQSIENQRIVDAIREAESKTSAEIRVFISNRPAADPMVEARRRFERMGMAATTGRNGILIFVAPVSRTFAVFGDQGIHDRCGEPFWQELASAMEACFRKGEFTPGIVGAIERAGTALASHFPRQPADLNELPDGVERG